MRKEIDWSKAPEGTTFVASFPDTYLLRQWFNRNPKGHISVWDYAEDRWAPVEADIDLEGVEYPPGEPTPQESFMSQFRDDEFLDLLTTEDREELFLQALPGSSYITVQLLKELLAAYDVDDIVIFNRKELNDFIRGE